MNDDDALTAKIVREGRICTLILRGDLDLITAAGFLVDIAQVVDDRTEQFVLDLAGLRFVDCTGARALVTVTDSAPSGCPVIIRSISPVAARLIDLLDLDLRHLCRNPARAGQTGACRYRGRNRPGPTALSERTRNPCQAGHRPAP